jgi:hypothetical protein
MIVCFLEAKIWLIINHFPHRKYFSRATNKLKRTANIHSTSIKTSKGNSKSRQKLKSQGLLCLELFLSIFIQQFHRRENIAESM